MAVHRSAHLLADPGVAGVLGDIGVAGKSGEEDIARSQDQTRFREENTGDDSPKPLRGIKKGDR